MVDQFSRREFVATCSAAAACATLPACSGLTWVPNQLEGEKLVFDATAFGEHRCVGLEHPRVSAPIAVCRLDNGSLSAVSALCTHKACELRLAGKTLDCPCHGSSFSLTGEVLSKPASRNLRRFHVEQVENKIYVGA